MKEELAVFENRSDDWLAKERKYEDSVSAWDLDDGKRLKVEHRKNCEAEYIKEEHEKKHEKYNLTHDKGVVNGNDQFQTLDTSIIKKFVISAVFIFIFCTAIGVALELGVIGDEWGFAIPIIIFILFINILPNKKRRK